MSATGQEPVPGLEKQRWVERVAQDGNDLKYAAAALQGDREVALAAVAQAVSALYVVEA